MKLISLDEFNETAGLNKFGYLGRKIGALLFKILKINQLNATYDKIKDKQGQDFYDAFLEDLGIRFEIPESDLKRIPENGAFISISNHPLGGIDGIVLLKILSSQRPDYKIIANFLLHKIKPLKPFVFPVNPFEDRKDIKSSLSGVKEALGYLKDNHPIGIFPAGEVSTFQKQQNKVVDKEWENGAIRLIKKAQVPVIPVYFHAKNSSLFYRLSRISSLFRTALLPAEMYNKKDKTIIVRIGQPIKVKEQDEYDNIIEFGQYIRMRTYMLANSFNKKKLVNINRITELIPQKKAKEIINETPKEKIEHEIQNLVDTDSLLTENHSYQLFFSEAAKIPSILREIGRLRETTFREVGEGTNKPTDTDQYDQIYHHLFLWDKIKLKLVGAYRMGLGKELYENHGITGFYVSELFRFDGELHEMFTKTIELGRAFIVKEYQQKPFPLFLLWKGIIHVALKNPEYEILMGGVSISNQFSDFSKSIMIEFMKSHYYDPFIAQYVTPKKEYKVRLKEEDKQFVLQNIESDVNKFDKIIDEIEPGLLRFPVLLKKYIKQNARIVAFNVDPKFNNTVDGLIYIKVNDLPESTVKPVMEEMENQMNSQLNNKKG